MKHHLSTLQDQLTLVKSVCTRYIRVIYVSLILTFLLPRRINLV